MHIVDIQFNHVLVAVIFLKMFCPDEGCGCPHPPAAVFHSHHVAFAKVWPPSNPQPRFANIHSLPFCQNWVQHLLPSFYNPGCWSILPSSPLPSSCPSLMFSTPPLSSTVKHVNFFFKPCQSRMQYPHSRKLLNATFVWIVARSLCLPSQCSPYLFIIVLKINLELTQPRGKLLVSLFHYWFLLPPHLPPWPCLPPPSPAHFAPSAGLRRHWHDG